MGEALFKAAQTNRKDGWRRREIRGLLNLTRKVEFGKKLNKAEKPYIEVDYQLCLGLQRSVDNRQDGKFSSNPFSINALARAWGLRRNQMIAVQRRISRQIMGAVGKRKKCKKGSIIDDYKAAEKHFTAKNIYGMYQRSKRRHDGNSGNLPAGELNRGWAALSPKQRSSYEKLRETFLAAQPSIVDRIVHALLVNQNCTSFRRCRRTTTRRGTATLAC